MPRGTVFFHYQHGRNRIHHATKRKEWLLSAIVDFGKEPGRIDVVFCSDAYLLEINRAHLQHDTYTDIITFDYCESNQVSGEIYISTDRVRENASIYGIALRDELDRVLVHGILHLLGYTDKTKAQKAKMTATEDYYLSLRTF
jgi:rRNA maturation RNase YbeY